MSDNPLAAWGAKYYHDPVAFVRDVLGAEPYRWQQDLMRNIARTWAMPVEQRTSRDRQHSVRSGHRVGKAQPLGMELDTPTGRRRFGELEVGDEVFGLDGSPTQILAVIPQGIRPCLRVRFDDGSSTEVDPEHEWLVRGRGGRRWGRDERAWRVLTTRQLQDQGVLRPNGKDRAVTQWEIPTAGAVQYRERDVPVPAYLLGVWLGDGTVGTPNITSADAGLAGRLEAVGARVVLRKYGPGPAWRLTVPGLNAALRRAGVWKTPTAAKRVPREYRENSAAVRLAVLQGLMDTDGTCGRKGQSTFTSTSPGLVEDVIWLARSLGGKASRHPAVKTPWYTGVDGLPVAGRPAHTASLRLPAGVALFQQPEKQARVRPGTYRGAARRIVAIEASSDAEMQCIQVAASDGLYLTNDFLVTHNSTVVGWIALWAVTTRFRVKVIITAPTKGQLEDGLVAEMKSWARRLPADILGLLTIKSDRIELTASPEDAFIAAATARQENPEALQGKHSDYVLLIGDEASGIPEPVFEAAIGSMASKNAVMLLTSNPTRGSGYFFETHNQVSDRWTTYHVDSREIESVDLVWVEDMKVKYGEDSNVFAIRVAGQFPKADSNTIIPLDLVLSAVGRDIQSEGKEVQYWGMDVARRGEDSSALVKRSARALLEVPQRFRNLDTGQLAGQLRGQYDGALRRPEEINVDIIGWGAGVVDRSREAKLPVFGINVGESTQVEQAASYLGAGYANLRSELWFRMREWFETRAVTLPSTRKGTPEWATMERLVSELTFVRYDFTERGKLLVESKDSLRDRKVGSPDMADALSLTFAGRAVWASGEGRYRSKGSIRRNRKGIV